MQNNYTMISFKKWSLSLMAITLMACGGNEKTGETQPEGNPAEANNLNIIRVTVQTLQPKKFEHYFEVNGTVKSDFDVLLSPEMSGQIKRIFVKEGDKVSQGQLLLKLNTSIIQNNINEVKTSLELATIVFKKQEKLWKEDKVGSEIQYLEAKTKKEALEQRLKALQAQMALSELKAPFAGIVDNVMKKEGEVVAPGMPVMELVNLKQIYVDADVAETYLPHIRLHDSVYVKFPALGDEYVSKATVSRIGNVINPGNRTFSVRVDVVNPSALVKPNLMAYVGINDYRNDSAMVVPSEIILQDNKGHFVYTLNGKNAVKKYVNPLFTSGPETTIQSAELSFGDKVIVKGYNQVTNGSEVKVVSK